MGIKLYGLLRLDCRRLQPPGEAPSWPQRPAGAFAYVESMAGDLAAEFMAVRGEMAVVKLQLPQRRPPSTRPK